MYAITLQYSTCLLSLQLYAFGVSRQSIKINSTNAEDFQFLIRDFFSGKYFLEDHGIQLADGGYIIPNDEGKAGKEEFFWYGVQDIYL